MLDGEKHLTLSEAAKVVPKVNGRRPHTNSVWRWCRKGLNDVKLEYVRVGRTIMTSEEALQRFFAALARADLPVGALGRGRGVVMRSRPRRRTLRQRAHDIAQAEKELTEAGI